MGLVDDLGAPAEQVKKGRRKALSSIIGATFSIAGVGVVIETVRFLRPNVLFESPTRFKVGRPEEISIGTLLVLIDQKIYIVRVPRGFYALSAVCTHLGCMTRYRQEDRRIFCPCHGSNFDEEGAVIEGPAPRPLPRFHLDLLDGFLVVDTRYPVEGDGLLEVQV